MGKTGAICKINSLTKNNLLSLKNKELNLGSFFFSALFESKET